MFESCNYVNIVVVDVAVVVSSFSPTDPSTHSSLWVVEVARLTDAIILNAFRIYKTREEREKKAQLVELA